MQILNHLSGFQSKHVSAKKINSFYSSFKPKLFINLYINLY